MQRIAESLRRLGAKWWRGSSVASFVVSGFVVLSVLGVAGIVYIRSTGQREAVRDAKVLTRIAGEGIVEPLLGEGILTRDPATFAAVDAAVRGRVLHDPIVRVKIWSTTGEILYSDDQRLIGKTFPLGDDELEILHGGGVAAGISNLSQPENALEPRGRKLLEVYLAIHTTSGRPVLFETYQRYRSVAASGRRLWLSFAPAVLGGLGLLWLVQVPLALRLARRLRESQREREELLLRAIQASDIERRRIARDLHDGVVQSLAGVTYSLSAAAERNGGTLVGESLREGAAATRQAIRELRSLLVEIYPPDLHRAGLAAALSDVVAPFPLRGLTANLSVPADLELPSAAEGMLFRIAQEALRNVLAHAAATVVDVTISAEGGRASVVVTDNGRGFDPAAVGARSFGLRLLGDLVRDAGGTLEVETAPGQGATLRAEVPYR